ncbi:sugar nucleotide-binding protein [Brevibacillus sp. SYSU BS000544]|uniref:sugar nucleotide-binding protein n=1 Tax=Brevibacillus sp. SYSU BS000544 TaxID=3416443 RepID=UPI003CE4845E
MPNSPKKRVLLLGGSGYLGAQINYHLRSDTACTSFSTCFTNSADPHLLPLDVTNEAQLTRILIETSPDVVIWALMSGQNESSLIQEGLCKLLTHLQPAARLIYLSTDGVFSQGTGAFSEDDETHPLGDANPLSGYTNAKLSGESTVQLACRNSIILRNGPIYGQNILGKWDNRTTSLLNQLQAGNIVSRASNLFRTFVHVDDLAKAICELVHTNYSGKLHLGPATKESYYLFNQKIAASLGLGIDNIMASAISEEEAKYRCLPLDTSLDTSLAHRLLTTSFRSI